MPWNSAPARGAGHGAGLRIVDAGPYEMGELAVLFGELPPPKLASAWVACVVDSVSMWKPGVGDTARALGVVAQRLHGVHWNEPIIGETALTQTSSGSAFQKATRLGSSPAGTPANPSTPPAPAIPGSTNPGGAGWRVCKGPAPMRKRGGRGVDELTEAIVGLQPGEHIVIKPDGVKRSAVASRVIAAKKRGGHEDLTSYESVNGDFVVCVPLRRAGAAS